MGMTSSPLRGHDAVLECDNSQARGKSYHKLSLPEAPLRLTRHKEDEENKDYIKNVKSARERHDASIKAEVAKLKEEVLKTTFPKDGVNTLVHMVSGPSYSMDAAPSIRFLDLHER